MAGAADLTVDDGDAFFSASPQTVVVTEDWSWDCRT